MKKFALGLSVCAAAFIIGCGGGSGSSSSSSTISTKTKVVATVEASIVKGAKVCQINTTNCGISDSNGKVSLYVPSLPVKLEVKIDNLTLGSIEANSPYVPVNPITLADNNDTLLLSMHWQEIQTGTHL